MNGGVVSCRDVVDVTKDSRWLGLVVHEPGTRAIAEGGGAHEERARIQMTDDAVRRRRLWIHALIASQKGGTQDTEQGRAVARRGAVVGVGGARCER